MKYGRLQVDIKRVNHPDAQEPLYEVTLQNPMSAGTGRPISSHFMMTWEDVIALFQATKKIVGRQADEVQEVSKAKDSTPFKEIQE